MAKLIGTGRPRLRHRVFAYLEAAVPAAGSSCVGPSSAGSSAVGASASKAGGIASGTWRWLLADAAGVAVAGPSVRFTSGTVAEKWLGTAGPRLDALGVATVTLLDGEHVVYGPAPLPRSC